MEGLNPEICSLIKAYRDNYLGDLYLEMIHQERYEREAIFARKESSRSDKNKSGTRIGTIHWH